MKIGHILLFLSPILLLGGCSTSTNGAQINRNTVHIPSEATEAEKVAGVLAQANGFADEGDMLALATALRALEGLGARAANQGVDDVQKSDPISNWRLLADAELQKLPPYRGRTLGPAYANGQLEPGQNITIGQVFMGGRTANVALSVSSNEPLNMTVTGAKNIAVCDHRPIGKQQCKWVPLFTERYSIKIDNVGKKAVKYYLAVD